MALANTRLDFTATTALADTLDRVFHDAPPPGLSTRPVRLAILGSSTFAHLHAAIRVGAALRGIWVTTYENDYGQYRQELSDPGSGLHDFRPDCVLFAFDARHVAGRCHPGLSIQEAEALFAQTCSDLIALWGATHAAFQCPILQQTITPVFPNLLGSNEHRLPGSPAAFVRRLNHELRFLADQNGVDLVALDDQVGRDGLEAWHDAGLWHRSKQEVTPISAPMYGELVARIIAAKQGRSFKCLVLDLDNTLWGGVIGDDGMEGIVIGQGSPLGEAFRALQEYARAQASRGVILAVCSKNDEANAAEPFEKHPDMVLKRNDIASFMANWDDKATNIRNIAHSLSIGLDAMVFVDDNAFERTLVRRELPMVAVPEIPEDPAHVVAALADAGYFEGLAITAEDRKRAEQYQGNIKRETLRTSSTDLAGYLRGLSMELIYSRVDDAGLVRAVQLINKTNQFNLTTRRYTEDDMRSVMADDRAFALQLRLIDTFGDNGIIAIVIVVGRDMGAGADMLIDTWLMSCRVLGRQVEQATMNIVAAEARRFGVRRLFGEYAPTKKNAMVRDHYRKLGFTVVDQNKDGSTLSVCDLAHFTPAETFIACREG